MSEDEILKMMAAQYIHDLRRVEGERDQAVVRVGALEGLLERAFSHVVDRELMTDIDSLLAGEMPRDDTAAAVTRLTNAAANLGLQCVHQSEDHGSVFHDADDLAELIMAAREYQEAIRAHLGKGGGE